MAVEVDGRAGGYGARRILSLSYSSVTHVVWGFYLKKINIIESTVSFHLPLLIIVFE